MVTADFYFTIEQPAFAEFKDRGSKFIAFAYPIETTDDAKKALQALKKEHGKANHFCFAYRIGTDGTVYRSSDDGEPSGSAGKPILGQLDSKGVTNTLVVVVRYFGGTLLGVPGLINAYKTSAALVLQVTPIIKKEILLKYEIDFDYTQLNDIMILLKQSNCEIFQQELQLFCKISFGVSRAKKAELEHRLNDIPSLQVKSL